jgi:hypothetical protein
MASRKHVVFGEVTSGMDVSHARLHLELMSGRGENRSVRFQVGRSEREGYRVSMWNSARRRRLNAELHDFRPAGYNQSLSMTALVKSDVVLEPGGQHS